MKRILTMVSFTLFALTANTTEGFRPSKDLQKKIKKYQKAWKACFPTLKKYLKNPTGPFPRCWLNLRKLDYYAQERGERVAWERRGKSEDYIKGSFSPNLRAYPMAWEYFDVVAVSAGLLTAKEVNARIQKKYDDEMKWHKKQEMLLKNPRYMPPLGMGTSAHRRAKPKSKQKPKKRLSPAQIRKIRQKVLKKFRAKALKELKKKGLLPPGLR